MNEKTIIIAMTGSKGGIGKTTSAVSISDALSRFHGLRVLLVETDGQASASFHLGLRGREAEASGIVPKVGLADVLRESSLEKAETKINNNLSLLAGGPDATAMIADHSLKGLNNSGVKLFRKKIKESKFDVCIIDAPPGIGQVTAFTWMSSDYVILPFQPNDVESIEAIRTIMTHLDAARKETGICPKLMGVIATNVDRRTKIGKSVHEGMKRVHSKLNQYLGFCRTDVNMVKAVAASKTIFDFAPASCGALHYKEISNEVFARIKKAQREAE